MRWLSEDGSRTEHLPRERKTTPEWRTVWTTARRTRVSAAFRHVGDRASRASVALQSVHSVSDWAVAGAVVVRKSVQLNRALTTHGTTHTKYR
ncbi:hypothetical protein LF1_56830 [Rubripirellula obstinata]|uniref:Uncharacterized protein n=1 Tax=Rubripirellula obstinata TaxID=406547 RepID=A0A5B1CAP2_9BACT|nr:hypothetical protein LF1_56830 [Rubripirellula obstinata]